MLRRLERLRLLGLYLLLGALLALVSRTAQLVSSDSTAMQQPPPEVKILAFNAHLLPQIALSSAGRRRQGEYRASAIGRRLAKYDLVGLSEVFDDRRRDELIGAAQAVSSNAFHTVWYPKPRGRTFANSGLLLLSRYPIDSRHLLTYRHASRFLTHGFRSDGFAAKGAIHARLRVDAHTQVDCFLTHLESQSPSARAGQIEDLARFIAEHASAERPAILLGDLNVAADYPLERDNRRPSSPYQQLLSGLHASGITLVDVWTQLESGQGGTSDALAGDGGRRIDYIFVSAPNAAAPRSLRPLQVAVDTFPDAAVAEGSLSDHAAVECLMRICESAANRPTTSGEKESAPKKRINTRSE